MLLFWGVWEGFPGQVVFELGIEIWVGIHRVETVIGWGDWWWRAFQVERRRELGRALMKMSERAQVVQGRAKKFIYYFFSQSE